MDHSLPGSSVHGSLQARILEWVSTPSLGDLPRPGIEPVSCRREVVQLGSLGQGALEPGCLISNPISAIYFTELFHLSVLVCSFVKEQ